METVRGGETTDARRVVAASEHGADSAAAEAAQQDSAAGSTGGVLGGGGAGRHEIHAWVPQCRQQQDAIRSYSTRPRDARGAPQLQRRQRVCHAALSSGAGRFKTARVQSCG